MPEVYIVTKIGNGNTNLFKSILEKIGQNEAVPLLVRTLGETGLKNADLFVNNIFITQENDPFTVPDEHPGPMPIIYIATGVAALQGEDLRSASLTIHEQPSDSTPQCELELADKDSLS